ncbi:MAG: deoxycytidylate deaminase [Planctomycetota bacterium]|jgi:dCMP deaminase
MNRPDHPDYFMHIAMAVRRRANCVGNRVGAIITLEDRIVSTGYNGTPSGVTNCNEGGCYRCNRREDFGPSEGYDLCICVHAEQNALLAAARFGIAVAGGSMYTTMRPCFGCAKEMLQARIESVYYLHEWTPKDPLRLEQYERLFSHFPGEVSRLDLEDRDAAWAVSRLRPKA